MEGIGSDTIRGQLQRLLEDDLFRHSRRYPALLRYVVEQTLQGRAHELKERTIGIDVFGRQPNYDLASDRVVRITASEIRKRRAQYYVQPAKLRELRIEMTALMPFPSCIDWRMTRCNPATWEYSRAGALSSWHR